MFAYINKDITSQKINPSASIWQSSFARRLLTAVLGSQSSCVGWFCLCQRIFLVIILPCFTFFFSSSPLIFPSFPFLLLKHWAMKSMLSKVFQFWDIFLIRIVPSLSQSSLEKMCNVLSWIFMLMVTFIILKGIVLDSSYHLAQQFLSQIFIHKKWKYVHQTYTYHKKSVCNVHNSFNS